MAGELAPKGIEVKQSLAEVRWKAKIGRIFKTVTATFAMARFPPRRDMGFEKETTTVESPRSIAVFSRDASIVKMIARGTSDSWVMENFADPHEGRAFPLKPSVRIVVIDDEAIEESTRGWLLDQVHKRAPDALVIHIAAIHGPQAERRARISRSLLHLQTDGSRTHAQRLTFVRARGALTQDDADATKLLIRFQLIELVTEAQAPFSSVADGRLDSRSRTCPLATD